MTTGPNHSLPVQPDLTKMVLSWFLSEFGANIMRTWIHWTGDAVMVWKEIFSPLFGFLSTNWAMFRLHNFLVCGGMGAWYQ